MSDEVYSLDNAELRNSARYSSTSTVLTVAKRSFDLLGATFGIILLSPLLLCLAIAIKATSKGPILFKQKRYGLNNIMFTTYKFRSMYLDRCDQTGVQQTVKDDPRITRVGNFLRRSNFDELPQLINVLKGEMSLVGPRPHVPGMLANGVPYEDFDPRYLSRHQVKPGITGLAQVNGFRGETKNAYAASMRLHFDLEYIRTRSMTLDLKIIVNTIIKEFFKGNGY